MPERPAPTIKTSKCSTVTSPSGGGGRQLVVQRALLTEQLAAPPVHEVGGVAVVRMEVRPVVVLQLVPQLTAHERGPSDATPAASQRAAAIGPAVKQETDDDLEGDAGDEAVAQDVHRPHAEAL